MTINDLAVQIQKLQSEGKGLYQIQAHEIILNEANGGNYSIDQNMKISSSDIIIDDDNQTVTFGEYREIYSY